MKKILTVAFLALATAFSVKANVLVITDVPVEAVGDNTVLAREAALKAGQEEAFRRLMQKMVRPEHQSEIAAVTPEQLMDMVRDVSVSNEKTTATKYMGSMSVRFKKAAVQSFLKAQDVPFKKQLPPPFLLVPVYENETGVFGLDDVNPFFASLKQTVPTSAIYEFRVPAGDVAEADAVRAVIANREATVLHPVLQKYGVANALFVYVTQVGTVYQVKTFVYPTTRSAESEVTFTVTDDRTRPVAVAGDLLADMVRYMDKQWAQKEQTRHAKKEKIQAVVPLASVAEMGRLQKELKRIRGVDNATVKGLHNKQLLVEMTFVGDVETLPERITGPFNLVKDGDTYQLIEKGVGNAENQ